MEQSNRYLAWSSYTLIQRLKFGWVGKHPTSRQKAFFASRSYESGEILCSFGARCVLSAPNYLTLQRSDSQHIMLAPAHLHFINHSCDPNVFFDTEQYQVVAIKSIAPGDELTFFYPSTEWNMAEPFACRCGSARCLGVIQGARYLSFESVESHRFTKHILQRVASQWARATSAC